MRGRGRTTSVNAGEEGMREGRTLVDMVAIGMWWAEKEENGLDLRRLKAGAASDEWDCCLRWWGTYADAKSSYVILSAATQNLYRAQPPHT